MADVAPIAVRQCITQVAERGDRVNDERAEAGMAGTHEAPQDSRGNQSQHHIADDLVGEGWLVLRRGKKSFSPCASIP